MAIPDFQSFMLPVLRLSGDGHEHALRDAVPFVSEQLNLAEEDCSKLLPSGRQTVVYNRVGWAKTFLAKAGLLDAPKRGHFRITDRGRSVLAENPTRVDNKYLSRFPEFTEFRSLRHEEDEGLAPEISEVATPEETIDDAYLALRQTLSEDLLDEVLNGSPAFFERLVVDLLLKMGYGGSRQDAGQAIGKSGDEGIDGIIKEDRLGLDAIYIQAKRWSPDRPVRRPDVQAFAGALQGQRARKGVFITTSRFTDDARDFARQVDSKIILIDGEELARLMIDFGVGVATVSTYEIKRVDSDYFNEGA